MEISKFLLSFLFMGVTTSIVSIGIKTANTFKIFKSIGDMGYKLNSKRVDELNMQINRKNIKNEFISLLIPVFNLTKVFFETLNFSNYRELVLTQLDIIGAIEKMTEIEKEKYSRKPGAINTLIISLESSQNNEVNNQKLENNFIENSINNIDSYMNNLENNDVSNKEITISEQKKALEDFKKELLNNKTDNNVKSLTKKKK